MGYTTRAVGRSPGVIEVKDFLIVLALFLGIILLGKSIQNIPNCSSTNDPITDEQIEEWTPFVQH